MTSKNLEVSWPPKKLKGGKEIMKKENTVCKKDVCQKQTNYGENILVKSKTEKDWKEKNY